jgi:hypothetical protein
MSLSIGGGNITPNPQLSSYELTVSTQDEVGKKGGTAGLNNRVIMLPNTEDVLLTQMARDSVDEYPITPERPLILPAGSFRSAGPNAKTAGEEAADIFNQLISELPLEMQKLIREARDQDALVLKEVLQDTAKALEIQQRALDKIETKDAIFRSEINSNFPIDVFRNVARVGKEFVESAKKALELLTPNDPSYLSSKEFVDALEVLMLLKSC